MSWLFSRALAEEYSEATCSGGGPYAPLSVMPTPHKFWRSDKTMEPSALSRFGLTCAVSTEGHGAALLTWYLGASRARTFPSPARAQGSMVSDPGYGAKWRASLATFDPDTRSWRTAQQSLLGGSDESSVTWPRSGMTVAGQCSELPTLGLRTSAIVSGLWPTPTCPNGGRSVAHVTDWRSSRTAYSAKGRKVQIDLAQAVKYWPTPTASLGTKGGRITPRKSKEGGTLIEAVSARRWPTPHGFSPDGKTNGPSGNELGRAVNQSLRCATPTARDWRSGKASEATHAKNSRPLSEQIGGSLNPTWVEWLMGWPIGWTDLKPLETGKFQQWQQSHGVCSADSDIREAA